MRIRRITITASLLGAVLIATAPDAQASVLAGQPFRGLEHPAFAFAVTVVVALAVAGVCQLAVLAARKRRGGPH